MARCRDAKGQGQGRWLFGGGRGRDFAGLPGEEFPAVLLEPPDGEVADAGGHADAVDLGLDRRVEVELDDAAQRFEMPAWIAGLVEKEVSEDARYRNAALAMYGLPT